MGELLVDNGDISLRVKVTGEGPIILCVPGWPELGASDVFDQLHADRFFHVLHFQQPGVPEAELEADLRAGLKRCYFALSGDAPCNSWLPDAPRGVMRKVS